MRELGWVSLATRRNASKMIWFYKIYVEKSPPYLYRVLQSYLLVTNLCTTITRYAASNFNKIITIRCRTVKYYNSFFPNCVRQWNSLKINLSVVTSLYLFKMKVHTLWPCNLQPVTVCNEYIALSNTYTGQLITQFRMGLSPLRHTLFSCCIIDNPFCPACGIEFETVEHFLLYCSSYNEYRLVLLNEITELFVTNGFQCVTERPFALKCLIGYVLKGVTEPLPPLAKMDSTVLNKLLFKAVSRYINNTKRFQIDHSI